MQEQNRVFEEIYKMNSTQLDENFQYLGEGMGRKVFALNDDFVIKVAKNKHGVFQNRIEHYIFTHAEPPLKKYLCPLVWFKPKMIVMQRAQPYAEKNGEFIDLEEMRKEPEVYQDLMKLTRKFKLLSRDVKFASSWGRIGEENFIIDYGWPKKTGMLYYKLKFSLKHLKNRKMKSKWRESQSCVEI